MKAVRIATAVLATSLALSAFVLAQTAPAPDIALPAGDTIRGKGIFEGKGNCQSCHRVNGIGSLYGPDLSAIGAVVIGGTSLFGGVGTVLGSGVGAFIPTVLQNGLVIKAVQPFWQEVVVGAAIILAVYIDQLRRRRANA